MTPGALQGVRVLELGPYVALPLTGRILSALGAEVIKVETNSFMDVMNYIPHYEAGVGRPEYEILKRRVSLNVNHPEAKAVMEKLVRASDVFITNFRQGVLKRWGIDFPALKEINPDLNIVWQTGAGEGKPYNGFKFYGMPSQHVGVSSMTGFEDEVLSATNTSYSDYHCGLYNVLAVISSLLAQRRTKKPTFAETSIFKSAACTLGPAVLDYQANHHIPVRRGNRDQFYAPHNAYQCKGEDSYCAIAVRNDEEWQCLCAAIGQPALANDPRFTTTEARFDNADPLDELISAWTSQRTRQEAMDTLQKVGVPAGIVAKGEDFARDAHLKERNLFREAIYFRPDQTKPGVEWQPGTRKSIALSVPIGLSETPCKYGERMSRLGEDNDYVYGQLLGMSPQEIKRLTDAGVLS